MAVDPVLKRLIEHVGPVALEPRRLEPFRSLVHAIAHQQLNGKAATSIFNRFLALFGEGRFPTPEDLLALERARVRACGFSNAKADYIESIARHAAKGRVPALTQCDQMTDAQLIECLTEIKGVGRWTAEMFLIFNLGRPDVLPVHDFGVRRGFQIAYRKRKMPEPKQLEKHGRRWAPHRTTAALYLYRAADQLKPGEW